MVTPLQHYYSQFLQKRGAHHGALVEVFPAWLEMNDIDIEAISEEEWMTFLRDEGLSEDEAMEYLETLAEWGGRADEELDNE